MHAQFSDKGTSQQLLNQDVGCSIGKVVIENVICLTHKNVLS